MSVKLETDRLLLRYLTVEDAAFMLELLNSPGWLQYIGDRGVRSIEQAERFLLGGILKSYEERGFGFYLLVLKESAQPIGICGLIKRDGLDDVDIGYALLPEYEGKGYAYESAATTLAYAREVLGINRIVAITTHENVRSQQLLRKIGLQFEKTVCLPGDSKELSLFATQP